MKPSADVGAIIADGGLALPGVGFRLHRRTLANGRVLVVGGVTSNGFLASAEVYVSP